MKAATRLELRYLLASLRPYRGVILLVVVASFLSSSFDCVSIGMLVPLLSNLQSMEPSGQLPWLLRSVTQLLAPLPMSTQILLSIALVVTAILLKNAFLELSIYLGCRVSSRLAADLRTRATTMLFQVGLEYHHRTKVGELIEKTLNNTASLEGLVRQGVDMVAHAITFLVLFGLLVVLSWKLTVIALLIGVIFMWLTTAYTRRLAAIGQAFASSSRELLNTVHENLSGIQLIKAFAREKAQLLKIGRLIRLQQRDMLRLNFRNYVVHLLTDVLGACAIGGLFILTMLVYEMDSKLLIVILFPFVYVITRLPITRTAAGERSHARVEDDRTRRRPLRQPSAPVRQARWNGFASSSRSWPPSFPTATASAVMPAIRSLRIRHGHRPPRRIRRRRPSLRLPQARAADLHALPVPRAHSSTSKIGLLIVRMPRVIFGSRVIATAQSRTPRSAPPNAFRSSRATASPLADRIP